MSTPVQVYWPGYGECEKCGALPGRPCGGLGPHAGRPFDPSVGNAGPAMLEAVRADLADVDIARVPGGHTYQALALWLAGVIDKRGSDDGPSVTTKLAERLTVVMEKLTRKGGEDDSGWERFEDDVSTPSLGG